MRHFLKTFLRSETGSQSVEAVFAFPLVALSIIMTLTFWDGFHTKTVSQRATYTIADMLSREKQAIDADYLTAMHELYSFVSNEESGTALRVSVVEFFVDPDTAEETLSLQWSEGVGGPKGFSDITQLEARVPLMASGDQLIIVESFQDWTPHFNVGLGAMRFDDVAIARPRFAPKLIWDDGTILIETSS